MRFSNPNSLWLALGVGILTSVSLLPQAQGEMVYETELQPQSAVMQAPQMAPAPVQVMQVPQQVQQPQYFAPQPAAYSAAVNPGEATEDSTMISKSELVRRERMRTELRNEDVLQERLEELRLRDERRRSDELVSGQPITANPTVASAFGIQQQVPTTERIGQMAQTAPVMVQGGQVAAVNPMPVSDAYGSSGIMTSSASAADYSEREITIIYMQPRFGLTSFNDVTYYDIRSKYSAGLGLGLSVSDNLSFEVGYTYSEFGVAMNSTNPFAIGAQLQANTRGYTGLFESVAMKQNIVDTGLKIHFLGPSAKLRPFIGGGARIPGALSTSIRA